MINSRSQYLEFLHADAVANYRTSIRVKPYADHVWKYIVLLRRRQYFYSIKSSHKVIGCILYKLNQLRLYKLGVLLGYTILTNDIGKGFSLAHCGTIVINSNAKIGKNCRIHEGVTIGSTSGSKEAAIIGDNVFIGTGAKIIGAVRIANDAAIGANAVVVHDILEEGTTWAGVPAKKISNNNSHSCLAPGLDF